MNETIKYVLNDEQKISTFHFPIKTGRIPLLNLLEIPVWDTSTYGETSAIKLLKVPVHQACLPVDYLAASAVDCFFLSKGCNDLE